MTPRPQRPERPSRPDRPERSKTNRVRAPRPEKPSDPTPDPLADVEYTGNVEEDSARELTAYEQSYRDRAKNEANRFKAATDSEFWIAVCFASRDAKESFLDEIGLTGSKRPDKYIRADLLRNALKANPLQ